MIRVEKLNDNSLVPNDVVKSATVAWVEHIVVGLNLCPFAKRELVQDRIRFKVSEAVSEQELLEDLHRELGLIQQDSNIETTLLIHPRMLLEFANYNQFLDVAEELIRDQGLEGQYQLASFHPDYQFADAAAEDVENYTNRSPFPVLHIINEDSLETALSSYSDADKIPERNMRLLRELGRVKMKSLLESCFE